MEGIYPKKIGSWVPPPPKSDGNGKTRHLISQVTFQNTLAADGESPAKAMQSFLEKSESYSPVKARHFRQAKLSESSQVSSLVLTSSMKPPKHTPSNTHGSELNKAVSASIDAKVLSPGYCSQSLSGASP